MRRGFTIVEMVIVIVVIAILAMAAIPSWRTARANMRLRSAANSVSDALSVARARAIAAGDGFVVYFNTGVNAGRDICGNDLVDAAGNPAPILVLRDANDNCCVDGNEETRTWNPEPGIRWGADFAASEAPGEAPAAAVTYSTGTTFVDPAGGQTEWVLFRPDGIPVGFQDNGGPCAPGGIGTGNGGVYLTNGERDVAVVMSALGGLRTHGFEKAGGAWTD
jgi:prepilin-type N-terminal cleavage/methylation domain-containing protein